MLDETFISAALIKEPSARARMLAAQWARQPPVPSGASEVEAPDPDADEPSGKKRLTPHPWARFWSTVRTGAVVLTVLALIVVVLSENYFSARPPNQAGRAGAFPGNGPAAADPFAGTPADTYANGPEGILVPDRSTLPNSAGFSADDIDAALTTTRQILIEANLNPRTLRGGAPPMAVEDWLDEADRARLERTFARPPVGGDPTDFVTRFDPNQTELVGSVVKVQGNLTYRLVAPMRLAVYAAYLFVYPVRQAGSNNPVHRVVVRRFNEFDFVAASAGQSQNLAADRAPAPSSDVPSAIPPQGGEDPLASATPGPSVPAPSSAPDRDSSPITWGPASSDFAGIRCQPPDGFLHPDFTLGSTPRVHPPGTVANAYDLKRPYHADARCVPVDMV